MPPTASTVATYRYLRVGIVGLIGLLAVSVVVETGWGGGLRGSVSEYYYTPVRGVFVGALTAIGLSLVAIKGRDGVEDVLLNLAGMLAPLVALVPTPLTRSGGGGEPYVPPELLPAIENNVTSLLVLGPPALLFALVTAVRARRRGAAVAGFAVALAGFLALTAWYVLDRDGFVLGAHYAAAVLLFVMVSAVALLNARAARLAVEERPVLRMLPAGRRAVLYRLIALGILLTLAATAALAVLDLLGAYGVLWVEVVLLGLFSAFWLLQTAEYWRRGAPDEPSP